MTTLAWIYPGVLLAGVLVAFGIGLCLAASKGDDELAQEGELPWGS